MCWDLQRIVITLITLGGVSIVGTRSEFTYPEDNLPENWSGMCSSGTLQSPIDLEPEHAILSRYSPINFINYETQLQVTAVNTGHSLQVNIDPEFDLKITAGGLPGVYLLDQMHFHWASEHTMSGKRYPLELHLVHHESRFKDIAEALQTKNGVAVLGVLFHLSDKSNPNLDPIVKIVENVNRNLVGTSNETYPKQGADGHDYEEPSPDEPSRTRRSSGGIAEAPLEEPLSPAGLLPTNRAAFYRYQGSLTTPTCDEAVFWTVFTDSLPVSEDQIEQLKSLMAEDGTPMKRNYRALKPLNRRSLVLQESADVDDGLNSGGFITMAPSITIILVPTLTAILNS